AVSVWWQILLNPTSRSLDATLNARAAAAIAAGEAWTKREPRRGEAWFYLAGAYAPLVQWRGLRGHWLAAAREGNKIKTALERAAARYPTNPLSLQRIAVLQSTYFHDHSASAAAWRRLLDRARSGRVTAPQRAEAIAERGLARELAAIANTRAKSDRKF